MTIKVLFVIILLLQVCWIDYAMISDFLILLCSVFHCYWTVNILWNQSDDIIV